MIDRKYILPFFVGVLISCVDHQNAGNTSSSSHQIGNEEISERNDTYKSEKIYLRVVSDSIFEFQDSEYSFEAVEKYLTALKDKGEADQTVIIELSKTDDVDIAYDFAYKIELLGFRKVYVVQI